MRWALPSVAARNGEEIASHDHCHSSETGGYARGIASPGALRWAVMFGSIIGIALVGVCWASVLFLTAIEEHGLESEVGLSYCEYKYRVRGRVIPGLPA